MLTESTREFDLGPLSWVQGEIDQSLAHGLEALAAFRADFSDTASLKHARAHVHQAAGALQMVGLDAVTAYTDEIERQLASIDERPVVDAPELIERVDRACRRLQVFLGEVADGAAPVPLELFPEYEAMQRGRGVAAVSPAELFYPDLDVRAPRQGAHEIAHAASLTPQLLQRRRDYQHGLLDWLRGNTAGLGTMRQAIAAIDEIATPPALHAFWWTVSAFLEGLESGAIEASFGAKQLVARIDMQIRRVAEGSAKVSDRLRREVLYQVANATSGAPQIDAVQRAFRLRELIPSRTAQGADVVRLQPILREAREQVASAKDAWMKAASGRPDLLTRLRQLVASINAKAVEIGPPALVTLTGALALRLDEIPDTGVPETVAIEFATALLLVENALENRSRLTPDFAAQVDAMIARLDAARAGREVAPSGAAMLDEMSKRAQDRALLTQVMHEVQVNLRHMEQVLDAFFRDRSKRTELAGLARDSQQIRGALRVLDLDDADRLLALCEKEIDGWAQHEAPIGNDELELLAESLSGLGFYVDAVLQQRPGAAQMIAPLIAKRLGTAPEETPVERASVEHSVSELRAALPRLVEEVRAAPADPAARAALRAKFASLRDDAELIGDADLAAEARAALRDLDAGAAEAAVPASVERIVDAGAAPAPEISAETQRLLATDAGGLDAELLDIYLTEAVEVLATVDDGHRALAHNSADREALVSVRRQFHTLKGSGRMVGLTELGEQAWGIERVFNRVLEDDRRVTPVILELIRIAQLSFGKWVSELRTAGRIATDPAALDRALAAVEAELPPAPSRPVRAVPAPPPASAPAAEAAGTPAVHEVPALSEVPAPSEVPGTAAVEAHAVVDVAADASPASPEPVSLPPPIDLPEVGAPVAAGHGPIVTSIGEPVAETIDIGVPPDSKAKERPLLRVVADNTLSPPSFADLHARGREGVSAGPALRTDDGAVHDLRAARDDDGTSATPADAPATPADVRIGDAVLSEPLWRILSDEARQHVSVLEHEVSLLQFDPDHMPLTPMLRASHTLCGIHRTGGIELTAGAAQCLEQALIALERHGPPYPGHTQPVLARATAALAQFVARLRAREGFDAGDEHEADAVRAELDELRTEVSAQAPVIDLLLGEDDVAEDVVPQAPATSASEPVADEDSQTVHEAAADPKVEVAADTIADDAAMGWTPVPEPALLAAVAPAIPPDETLLDVTDEVDELVLPIFLEEAGELVPRAGNELRLWRRNPDDHEMVGELRRTLHTLKGSARMAGAMRLGELAHRMESRLSTDESVPLAGHDVFEALDTDLDRIGFVLEALREGRSNVALPWLAPAADDASATATAPEDRRAEGAAEDAGEPARHDDRAASGLAAIESAREEAALDAGAAHRLDEAQSMHASAGTDSAAGTDAAPAGFRERRRVPRTHEPELGARAMLRVRADILDRLVNEAGEVSIARARVESELRALKGNLLELTNSVIRLRGQVREIELAAETQIQSRMSAVNATDEGFDPLELDRYTRFQELTRSLAEGINDVSTVQQSLLKNLDDADIALLAQSRLSRDVQQRLLGLRTVPFNSLTERLYRTLRKTARELGKRANLEIDGAQTELDRSVLEKLAGPIEHLLRNALDHGIETRDERIAAGKRDTGEIRIAVHQAGNEIAIELADDGRGIDFARVRNRAVAAGLVAADAEPPEADLVECLFQPGFSTASEVTQISGRGIGMDVVRNEIVSLGGRIEIHSTAGQGTRFNLFLPLTLAVTQAVLVRALGRLWALPAAMIDQVQQTKPDALASLYVEGSLTWRDRVYPFHYLARLLGDAEARPAPARYNPVLIARNGQGSVAIHVDEMVGNQEVVVKHIGQQLARVPGIAGATVLGTGEIVLILNPVQLAQRTVVPVFRPASAGDLLAPPPAAAQAKPGRKLVMVVDDSLTVRKFTTRFLTREGYDVVSARDGVEGLQLLAERSPDVILLDIEMPRMDGFEFAKSAKGNPATSRIPIVMITSRTADKHRNRAIELGVDAFLGKPYQEDELLRNLRGMLGEPATAASTRS
ncbi:MAG: Hpt domain-containing protein [Proteobacteria bacterium]|nr:Hpt domain-containing protein [Pseudomonadota bacterium]